MLPPSARPPPGFVDGGSTQRPHPNMQNRFIWVVVIGAALLAIALALTTPTPPPRASGPLADPAHQSED